MQIWTIFSIASTLPYLPSPPTTNVEPFKSSNDCKIASIKISNNVLHETLKYFFLNQKFLVFDLEKGN